jgi:hypothetical protein
VENLVGTGLFEFGDRDGGLDQAQLQHVSGISALGTNRLAITDAYNHKVKIIDLESGTVTSILGTGDSGGRLGDRDETELNEPGGLTAAGDRILVADTNNHRILSLDPDQGEIAAWALHE